MDRDRFTIVIVEDNQEIRESIQDALELEGYRVVVFKNGKEAIDGLKDHHIRKPLDLDSLLGLVENYCVHVAVRGHA